MKSNLAIGLVLCASLGIVSYELAKAGGGEIPYISNQHRATRSPFRYVIVSNSISGEESDPNDDARHVDVLLDDRAFSETNLKMLFKLLSGRFPLPKVLDVRVYTNLEDVETPEEREAFKASEGPDDPSEYKYRRAFYLRDYYGNEWFTYNPTPPSRPTITIVLKGRSPHAPDK
ncbi:MAG: hypothetical protein KIT57_23375 [Blastocatellales bacterium]|nr:hypothetical protein [Blastocatellales bacterium]